MATSESGRFATLNTEEYNLLLQQKDSENTQRDTKKAVRVFQEYLKAKQLEQNFENWGKEKLADVLRMFYVEARRENGERYKSGSMINIRAGINRHLKNTGMVVDITKEPIFSEANRAFKAVQVELKKIGKGDTTHYDAVDKNDLQKLYSSGVFDMDTPRGLQYKVWFQLMLYICRRGRENLRKLTREHFDIATDSEGRRYVYQCKDEMTKKVREENRSTRVDAGRMYETKLDDCPVAAYEKYLSKLNPKCDALFQTPMHPFNPQQDLWYKNSPVGERTLGLMMATISNIAGLSRRYTNHSLRATCITILDQRGFSAKDICNISGHSNESSIRSYAGKPGDNKKQQLSDALTMSIGQPPKKKNKDDRSSLPIPNTSTCSTRPITPDPVQECEETEDEILNLTASQLECLETMGAVEWDTEITPPPVPTCSIPAITTTSTMPMVSRPTNTTTSVTWSSTSTTNTMSSSLNARTQQVPVSFNNCNCSVTINYNFNK